MTGFRHLRQLNGHVPAIGVYGDCHRTCLAMILGCEPMAIPNWGDESLFGDDWRARKREWFAERGIGVICFALDLPTVADTVAQIGVCSSGPVELSGRSPRGDWNHAVVVADGRIFDPHPSDAGLAGPCGDGFFWVETMTYLPLSPAAARMRGRSLAGGASRSAGASLRPQLMPVNHAENG